VSRRDEGLDRLLDLDGFLAEVGGSFWLKIVAPRVPSDDYRQHGVSDTLTLHDPAGQRFVSGPRSSASGRIHAALYLSRR
jgi:hypothetical protein